MAEDFKIDNTLNKKEKYKLLIAQLNALVDGEEDIIANYSNVMAALKESFRFLWVGIYFARGNELVLGPFQGPVACTRIKKGKGVCGTVFETGKPLIVEDVEAFPGHIACSSFSKSEIVLPIMYQNTVHSVLDVDSDTLAYFNSTDQYYLQQIVYLLEKKIN